MTSPTTFAPPTPNRDRVVTLRLTSPEVDFIDNLAVQHGLNRAETMREIFAGRIAVTDPPVPSGPTTDFEIGG